MNFFQKNLTRNCVVIGSKTSARWNLLKNNVSIYDIKNKKWQLTKFKKTVLVIHIRKKSEIYYL